VSACRSPLIHFPFIIKAIYENNSRRLAGAALCVAAGCRPAYKVTHSIAVGGEAHWDYLTIDSGAHRLYVSHGTQTEVIGTQSEKVVGTITRM
jgi:hypothetical protein